MTEQPNIEDRKKTKKVGKEGVIEIIGEAIAKNVFCGRFDEKCVVIKRVDHFDIKYWDIRELKYLREFDHENVVKYKFKDVDDDFLYMVLEKCDTTLTQFITGDRKDEIYHLDILWQISKGLAYLHEEKDLVHRDLKPSNVLMLLRDKQRWVAKITDFGISKSLPSDRTRVTQSAMKGTEGYMAPEQRMGGKIGKHADIFSLGLVFHFVLSEGKHPFGSNTLEADTNMLDKSVSPDLNSIKAVYMHDAETLILCMIARQAKDRLHIKQVQAHHLFWSPEKKLTFYQQVSDHIISQQMFDKMKPIFEERQTEVADDWRQRIRDRSAIVGKELDAMKNKRQGDGICDLMRNIRNLKNHYDEKATEFQVEIGKLPDGVYQFFKLLFPKLLNYVYDIMKRHADDSKFVDYYVYREQEHLRQPLGSSTDIVVEESPSQSGGKIDPQQTASLTEVADVVNNSDSRNQDEVKENAPELAPGTGLTHEIEIMAVDKKEGESSLVLRNYQWELAQPALRGENSLIVAPTGSGKTAVLTEVIKQHLKKFQKNGRVMFMVPKTALARQQFRYLQRHLEGRTVEYMIGQSVESAPINQRILDNHITVLTPQILINELKKDLSFNDLSMLIFDECHNTTKCHPYRQLMDMLLDFEDIKSKSQPIQVIGVTASPGVGKAKDQSKVKDKLIELLGNLNVMFAPTTVEINVEELGRHHSKIKEYFLQVQTEKEFANEVETAIEEVESAILKLLKDNRASLRNAPSGKASQPYDNWIEDLKTTAQNQLFDGENSRLIRSYAANLKLYHYLLQLKDLVPNAMEQAKKKTTLSTEGPERAEMERKYEELQTKAANIQTPMFEKLLTILQGEFKQNPNARCMVFVEWKLTAECLSDRVSRSDKLDGIKSAYLIGTQTSGGTKGMTKTEQEVVVEDFRNGKYKVLIATSIAEEGLNFGECSLVIMYNYVTGEVGRQQRHGRGRTKTCRAIIMATVDSDVKKREENNKICGEATKKAIADIKKSNPTDLRQRIMDAQKKRKGERKRKAEETDCRNGEPPAKWQILCNGCRYFLTTGDKLRDLENKHLIVKDKEFFCRTKKINVKKCKGPVKVVAEYLCTGTTCGGQKVASGIVHEDKICPALCVDKILVKNEAEPKRPKQRKNLPFKIDISIDDSEGDDDDMYEKIDETLSTEEDSTKTSLNDQDCLEFLEIMENDGN